MNPFDVKAHNERKLNENISQLAPPNSHLSLTTSLKSTMATAQARKHSGSFDCVPGDWPKTAGPISVTLTVKRNKHLLKKMIENLTKISYELHNTM